MTFLEKQLSGNAENYNAQGGKEGKVAKNFKAQRNNLLVYYRGSRRFQISRGHVHVELMCSSIYRVDRKGEYECRMKYLALPRLGLQREARRPLLDILEILGPLFGVRG